MAASTGVLRLGGNGVWGEWFAGLIDEVRVYDRALSRERDPAGHADARRVSSPPPRGTTAPSAAVRSRLEGDSGSQASICCARVMSGWRTLGSSTGSAS